LYSIHKLLPLPIFETDHVPCHVQSRTKLRKFRIIARGSLEPRSLFGPHLFFGCSCSATFTHDKWQYILSFSKRAFLLNFLSVSNHRPYRHLATSFSTPKAVVGSYGAEGNPTVVPPRQPRLRARLLRRKALPRPSGHLSAFAGLDDSSLTAVRLAVQNFQSFDIMMS